MSASSIHVISFHRVCRSRASTRFLRSRIFIHSITSYFFCLSERKKNFRNIENLIEICCQSNLENHVDSKRRGESFRKLILCSVLVTSGTSKRINGENIEKVLSNDCLLSFSRNGSNNRKLIGQNFFFFWIYIKI